MIIVTGIFVFGYLETNRISVTHVTIHNTRLFQVLHGKTLVHLSDVHLRSIGTREKKVFELLEHLKPDIIVLTGDYIQWNGNVPEALKFLSRFKSDLGVYGVMGDYDFSDSRESCMFCHRQGTGERTDAHSVNMLENAVEHLQINGNGLTIAGMDYESQDESLIKKINTVSSKKKL